MGRRGGLLRGKGRFVGGDGKGWRWIILKEKGGFLGESED